MPVSASTSAPTWRSPASSRCSGARASCGGTCSESDVSAFSAAPRAPFVVGLTGGIGSGKSAAADAFARLGAGVVDTDAIADALTGPGGPALDGIKRVFGPDFVSQSNALNRERMRELVFRDPAQRTRLEA